jgi:hypothetical protein
MIFGYSHFNANQYHQISSDINKYMGSFVILSGFWQIWKLHDLFLSDFLRPTAPSRTGFPHQRSLRDPEAEYSADAPRYLSNPPNRQADDADVVQFQPPWMCSCAWMLGFP